MLHQIRHIVICIVLSSTYLFSRDRQLKEELAEPLDCLFLPSKLFSIIQASVVYYVPILVMVYLYSRAAFALYQNERNKTNIQKRVVNGHSRIRHKEYEIPLSTKGYIDSAKSERTRNRNQRPLHGGEIITVGSLYKEQQTLINKETTHLYPTSNIMKPGMTGHRELFHTH